MTAIVRTTLRSRALCLSLSLSTVTAPLVRAFPASVAGRVKILPEKATLARTRRAEEFSLQKISALTGAMERTRIASCRSVMQSQCVPRAIRYFAMGGASNAFYASLFQSCTTIIHCPNLLELVSVPRIYCRMARRVGYSSRPSKNFSRNFLMI